MLLPAITDISFLKLIKPSRIAPFVLGLAPDSFHANLRLVLLLIRVCPFPS